MTATPPMSDYAVNVQVDEEFEEPVSVPGLMRTAERAMRAGEARQGASVDVAVTGDGEVRELNRRYRGLDETTDVLSFSFTHSGEYQGVYEGPEAAHDVDFPVPAEADGSLGEVIISYPQAERQGGRAGHGTARELSALLAHGVLHLLGYDHESEGEAVVMRRLEAEVLLGT